MLHPQINLYFSHSVERLADILAQKVNVQQAHHSIFDAPKILVPNSNMQRYLQLSLAKKNRVCAHVDFPFLETGLFQLVNELSMSNCQHLNGSMLAWSIWHLLKSNKIKTNPVYQPISEYLESNNSSQLAATKLWQLSQKLSRLMIDYESQRPEMIKSWLQGKQVFGHSNDPHLIQLEAMQKDIYCQILGLNNNIEYATLFQLAAFLDNSDIKATGKLIHIFTPSRLSQLHRKLFLQLGQYMSINIYQLNVCLEYWEDMQTDQEIKWQQKSLNALNRLKTRTVDRTGSLIEKDDSEQEVFTELVSEPDENKLLKAWGKPGRETLKLFSEIENDAIQSDIHFYDSWLPSDLIDKKSLLHTIQHNILYRTHDDIKVTDMSQLSSVQMLNAPSVVREVEAVYNSILWNLDQDSNLKVNDIAILVTDMDSYRFVIEQVFEELNHQHQIKLPYAIVDSTAAKESRYADAVMGLFAIMDDDFIRASVFNWLDNPCVQNANRFDEADWHDWLFVVDQLGIYCGYDHLYPEVEQTEIGVDISGLYTWEQGLKRLHQSLALMSEDGVDLSVIGADKIGQLSVLLETLNHHRARLQKSQTSVQWELQLNQLFDLFIATPVGDNKEQFVQMSLQQSLLKLSQAQPELILGYDDIKQFIQHEIKQIPVDKGNYLTGGVVCAALLPMRPVPFEITYVLGLDEKTFPGHFSKETLDLTHRSRRIGDINPVENKNYLFLETLMCVRNKLYLSYVGLDLLKDEIVQPSSIFVTLKNYCDELIDMESSGMAEMPVFKLPLDASECFGFDQQQLTAQDFQVNYSYADYLLYCSRFEKHQLPLPNNQRQQQIYHTFNAELNQGETVHVTDLKTNLEPLDTEQTIHVDANELADYLANPQASVLKRLGILSQHPEDLSLVEHEPLKLSGLTKHEIFTSAVQQWLQNPMTADFTALIEQQYRLQLIHSKAPVKLFANIEQLITVNDELQNKLAEQLTTAQLLSGVKVGDSITRTTPELSTGSIRFNLKSGQQICLHGMSENIFSREGLLSDMVVISSSQKISQWNKKLLKPFVNWCLWQLADDIQVSEPFKVHMVFPEKLHSIEFKPWLAGGDSFSTRSTIESYLQTLVSGYLQNHAPFLPYDLLDKLKIDKKLEDIDFNPLLQVGPRTKKINYLAYQPFDLSKDDLQKIKQQYQSGLQWPNYEEVYKLVESNSSQHPELLYREYLLPLFVMVFGKFEDID